MDAFDRIYLREIAGKLLYKDIRSVVRWCRNMGIRIYKDLGCKYRYISKADFEAALRLPQIKKEESLPPRAIQAGFRVYASYMEAVKGKEKSNKSSYKPQGIEEKNILQSILTGLKLPS